MDARYYLLLLTLFTIFNPCEVIIVLSVSKHTKNMYKHMYEIHLQKYLLYGAAQSVFLQVVQLQVPS